MPPVSNCCCLPSARLSISDEGMRRALFQSQTEAAGTSSATAARSVNPICLLLLHRVAHFLALFAHVVARLFQRVEFLLLRRRQDRANLRYRVLADFLDFLFRFLAGRHDLGLRLVEDRLNLRHLLLSEVSRFG